MLRKYCDHFGILGKGILLENPISLKTQFNIPESSESVGHSKLGLVSLTMALREAPELDKRSNELDLVTLSTDVCQANDQIILQKTLDDNTGIYSSQIEIDGKPIDHFKTIILDKVFEDLIKLCLRNILNSSVLDKLLQDSIKNSL